jgi:hypothetical protein
MSFTESPWTNAERTLFSRLLSITGGVEGKTAFIGSQPSYGNCWSFKIGGGGDEANTLNGPIGELWMNADAAGLFLERDRAIDFCLKILAAMPIRRVGNVQSLRLRRGGMPDVKMQELQLIGETKPRMVWVAEIGFEVVFNTNSKANVEPPA